MSAPHDSGPIEGVFGIERHSKIGTGTTAKRVKAKAFYYVKEVEDDTVEMQLINNKLTPCGPIERISKEELLEDYLPMPQLYKDVLGNLRKVQKALARGDKFRKRNETFTAEFEYANALDLDEANVRANFGIGLCLLARDEKEKAQEVFDRIVKIDAAFADEHKHLFNEYGIALRREKMLQQAVDYYRRALELSSDDENLWYNLGRALFDMEDWAGCADAAQHCLALNPDHPEGGKLLAYLTKNELI
ncbi:tetratricopeptide repeat protein [Pseudodesulfovibrio cashew]|uniref:Tetratricopeptide repeat protein n=1 Tax=Pseudodesulfovibrio cashew TaxID=2678688 RepID=A0A6I6JHW5_9BACT|nr:tetratricopeptide repeat protein [Pseudodesulfovibrio cashew]QGY40063.1 tetratricopeptide repeat protein [Pseudodesulfovibrio cashew]